MMKSRIKSSKILFISHDASLTGAPIVLLSLLQHVRKNDLFDFDVLLIESGELELEFKKLSQVSILHKPLSTKLYHKIYRKMVNKNLRDIKKYIRLIRKNKYEIIYANTVVSSEVACVIKREFPNSILILHLHELENVIDSLVGHFVFKSLLESVDFVISVSGAVEENILNNYGYDKSKSVVVYPFSLNTDNPSRERCDIRTQLDIKAETFIVGASGEVQWRKGFDVFLNLAYRFISRYPAIDCAFVWLGMVYDIQKEQINYDLKKCGIESKVHFVGQHINSMDYFEAFDVMTMVSREDPFPLVCIEAASLAKPILCFENAGGIPELVGDNCGFVVPYLDVETMCDKLFLLYSDQNLLKKLGKNASDLIMSKYSKEASLESIIGLIKNALK